MAEAAIGRKGFAIAISLDVANAFNSLPWEVINEALVRKGFPVYICRIIRSYLSERTVEYTWRDGNMAIKEMTAGVPQGSVLGPMLWNLGYDSVLRGERVQGCEVLCYADDTLILVEADSIEVAKEKAKRQANLVLDAIRRLGLNVAIEKTEAIVFYGRRKPKEMPVLDIDGKTIPVKNTLKYLGVVLDSKLKFENHFEYVENKALRIARMLGRIMPNLRGPIESKRRLYANVVHSVLLYGAPVWHEGLMASRKNQRRMNRVQRTIALRVIAAYRTTSFIAATLMARLPPLHLHASMRARIFQRVSDLKRAGIWSEEEENDIHKMKEILLRRQWKIFVENCNLAGARTREAILPSFEGWIDRGYGNVTFRITQLLTGHGCFGTYLARIGSVNSSQCEHCSSGEADSAEHTLQTCAA